MRPLRSTFSVGLAATVAIAASGAACSDEDRATVDPSIDAGSDANDTTKPTPEASTPEDAAPGPDPRGPYDPADVPVVCGGAPCATQIVAGSDHFCTRMRDGTVRCWGEDTFGVLGTPSDAGTGSAIPAIAGLSDVTQLSAAGATTCARLDDGRVACWGDNRDAQLGLAVSPAVADEDPHPTPSIVPLESGATRVDVGPAGACAVLASGKLWCWGRNEQDQLARPNEADAGLDPESPFRGPGLAAVAPVAVAQAAMSEYTTLGLSAEGQVWTWGALAGDLGVVAGRLSSVSATPRPKRLESLEKVTTLVASGWVRPPPSGPSWPPPPPPAPNAHACAIANGEVYCWGQSQAGALGTGVPDPAPAPTHAAFPRAVKAWPQRLAVADEITCARMTDGSVFCCGSNTRGRLGAGEALTRSASFVKASGFAHQAVAVATTDHAVCALVVDGTVECWGSNERGELGLPPDEADHPSAVKIAF